MDNAQFAFEAIGTHWNIELSDIPEAKKVDELQQLILERIDKFDKAYSRFREDSLVTEMSRRAGEYTLPEDAKPMMDLYQQLYEISDGAVTPLIGDTLASAGYDAKYSLKPGKVTAPPDWQTAIDYDFPKLTIKQPVLLDFGAAGKGYLTDIIGSLLEEQGTLNYVIDGGGDILHKTTNSAPIEIALEHPNDPAMAIGVTRLGNGSLCGSAGNRRAWAGYHHIIDPRTLQSPADIAALWVMADTGLLADGLATALFFTSPAILNRHYPFEYAIIRKDLSLLKSANFAADFFTDNK